MSCNTENYCTKENESKLLKHLLSLPVERIHETSSVQDLRTSSCTVNSKEGIVPVEQMHEISSIRNSGSTSSTANFKDGIVQSRTRSRRSINSTDISSKRERGQSLKKNGKIKPNSRRQDEMDVCRICNSFMRKQSIRRHQRSQRCSKKRKELESVLKTARVSLRRLDASDNLSQTLNSNLGGDICIPGDFAARLLTLKRMIWDSTTRWENKNYEHEMLLLEYRLLCKRRNEEDRKMLERIEQSCRRQNKDHISTLKEHMRFLWDLVHT